MHIWKQSPSSRSPPFQVASYTYFSALLFSLLISMPSLESYLDLHVFNFSHCSTHSVYIWIFVETGSAVQIFRSGITRAKGICHFKFMDSTKSCQKAKPIDIPPTLKQFKRKALPYFPTLFPMLPTANLRGKMKQYFTTVWLCILLIVTELLTS